MLRQLLLATLLSTSSLVLADLKTDIADDLGYVEKLYRELHVNPELSFKEQKTSKKLAGELRSLGFEVAEGVGAEWVRNKAKAQAGALNAGVDGYGVVGFFKNGKGSTILLRTDMDALPLQEKTGLSYASDVQSQDFYGKDAPVMHACGHDVHMSVWVGTARRLIAMKDKWQGTLVMIAQPAEEIGNGSRAMLNGGLFERFPKPDYNLALHVTGAAPAGHISYTPEYAMANVDSVDIRIKGVGGHGAKPHLAKDPIVIGSSIVMALQTLVARELNPLDPGVVTVGSFNAGFKHNIIPDEAHLQLTVRSYTDDVRGKLLSGIRRIARAQALSAGMPEDRLPVVTMDKDYTPAVYNDPQLVERIITVFKKQFGERQLHQRAPAMSGEDFANYGRTDDKIPGLLFFLGAADPQAFMAYKKGEGNKPDDIHSPFFAPGSSLTLQTGIEAMTSAALELFTD